jgi:hypothetical protein
MPYIITMKYTHPSEDFNIYKPEQDFIDIKKQYLSSGKILAQDYFTNPEEKTETVIVVFKDKSAFDSWQTEPLVNEFFQKRNQFLEQHQIVRTFEAQEI